jgi:O-antigen/teichoic acid export membrane protein
MWPACFVAIAGTLFAPLLLRLLFGERFDEAARPFQIAVWMIPVTWLSGHFRFSLVAAGRQDLEFRASAAGGLATVTFAAAGAWLSGASGAAAALVGGGLVHMVGAFVAMRRRIGAVRLTAALPAVAASAAAVMIGTAASAQIGTAPAGVLICALYAGAAISYGGALRLLTPGSGMAKR